MIEKASRGEAEYRSSLRAVFRSLWLDVVSIEQFTQSLFAAVDRGMRAALNEGLQKAGFQPEEASLAETQLFYDEIYNNVSRAAALAEFIQANSKANDGAWASVQNRLDLWANRYPALRTAVYSQAAGDKKAQWQLGATEEHCRTCYGFNGRVYRRSTWAKNNALPQSQALCCKGFRCDCSLIETEARITPGPFPRSLLCG